MLKLIPPNGNRKTYYVRGTEPVTHRRIDQSTGTAVHKIAKQIRDKLEKELLNGLLGRKVISFPEIAVQYVEAVNPGPTARDVILGWQRADGTIGPCLLTDFADVDDVRQIDQARVNRVIRARFQVTKHGRPYQPGSIMRGLIVPLTAILNHAARESYCDPPHFLRPRYNDKRERYGSDAECAAILKASAPHAAPIFLFAMYIGDRIGESLGLQIEDTFLDRSWAILRDTKNGTNRGIALHAQIVQVLRGVIGERRLGHVFLTNEGLPYETYPKKAWRQACERAGVENFRVHDLRHTFGTNADLAGMTQRQREKQMGHLNGSTNARYVHVPDQALIGALNKIPWRDYHYETDYRTWARNGYGRIVPERDRNEARASVA
jgi:integrase